MKIKIIKTIIIFSVLLLPGFSRADSMTDCVNACGTWAQSKGYSSTFSSEVVLCRKRCSGYCESSCNTDVRREECIDDCQSAANTAAGKGIPDCNSGTCQEKSTSTTSDSATSTSDSTTTSNKNSSSSYIYPSQCKTGTDSGAQTDCTHDNDEQILTSQCQTYHSSENCKSMSAYLSAMESSCKRIKPSGIDCEKISQGGYYGREASKFAEYESKNDSSYSAGSNSSSSSTSGTTSSGGLSLPSGTGLADPSGGIKTILTNVLNWMLAIIGIVAIISLIISGLQYFFAAGDERRAETAKRNITYSIIGIIVVLSAFVIIRAIDAALNATSLIF